MANHAGSGPSWVFRPEGQPTAASEPEFRGRAPPEPCCRNYGACGPMSNDFGQFVRIDCFEFVLSEARSIHLNFAELIHRSGRSTCTNSAFGPFRDFTVGIPNAFRAALHRAFRNAGNRQDGLASKPGLEQRRFGCGPVRPPPPGFPAAILDSRVDMDIACGTLQHALPNQAGQTGCECPFRPLMEDIALMWHRKEGAKYPGEKARLFVPGKP